ncbi:MAG: lipid-binding SYLF domain-containing protein [Gammaproteobacteria bacterium]|jgi:lipid-binding SYLF domain-containing protein
MSNANHHRFHVPGRRLSLLALGCVLLLSACASWNPNRDARAEAEARTTVDRFLQRDPSLRSFFDQAYAYAVFPNVGKGAATVGGAFGRGLVYRGGQVLGRTTLTQLTVGFQIGGQAYSELIFFRDKASLDRFRSGQLEFDAQASAVVAKAGAAANAPYERGVAVFTLPKGGFMFEASIGGQRFTYQPMGQ